jgi:hypothetical protein
LNENNEILIEENSVNRALMMVRNHLLIWSDGFE